MTIGPQSPSARCTSGPRIPRSGKRGRGYNPAERMSRSLWPTHNPQTASLVIHLQSGMTLNFLVHDCGDLYRESISSRIFCWPSWYSAKQYDGDLQGLSGQALSCKWRLSKVRHVCGIQRSVVIAVRAPMHDFRKVG